MDKRIENAMNELINTEIWSTGLYLSLQVYFEDERLPILSPIRLLSNLQSPVFLINSRLDLFAAPTSRWDPFSRSYGVNLPSSLTVIHSSTLGYSPRPPVSVYGTGDIYYNLEDFLGSRLGCTIKLPVGSLYCQVSARTNS